MAENVDQGVATYLLKPLTQLIVVVLGEGPNRRVRREKNEEGHRE